MQKHLAKISKNIGKIKDSKRINKVLPKNKYLRYPVLSVAAVLMIFFIFFGIYSIAYSKKIYNNQYIGSINLSGKTKSEAEKLLTDKTNELTASNIVLAVNVGSTEKTYPISPKDIGLSYDIKETVNSAWQYGREGNIISNFWEQLTSVLSKHQIKANLLVNDNALSEKIGNVSKEVDQPEKDFSISYDNSKFVLSTERTSGKRLNKESTVNTIKNHFYNIDRADVKMSLEEFTPQIKEENANKRLADANKILSFGDLVLSYEGQEFQADSDNIGSFLTFPAKDNDISISFNNDRIKLFVDSIATSINIEAKNAKLGVTNGKAAVIQSAQSGKNLDKDKTITLIQNALLERANSDSVSKSLALPVVVKQPEVTNDIANLGIVDLVGTATTDFKGSPANRVHNITVGANSLNGVLVKPGDEFSTLKQLGKIDESSGYLPELVIKENRTVPEFGGGLCQTSSTLFRAALNAGMKITERQNHKYRVSYYEPPVGMDASIYDPAPDFKFVNNYSSYVLVQSKIEGTKITFEMYGTKDSRVVEMSQPELSDPVNPGPPVYVETDTLPAGQKKQTEKAHQGATAKFNYKVTKDGKTLQEKTFTSKYVPWPEKWLVGKGTVVPNCTDGQQNGDEAGIDCGGTCPTACPAPTPAPVVPTPTN